MKKLSEIMLELQQHPERSSRIIAFGSSNTELLWHSEGRNNWVDFLNMNIRTHIGRHVCVINQGVCGETSEDLLHRLERDVLSFLPSIVIITIGGNDASRNFSRVYYKQNIQCICETLIGKNILPVLQTYYCPLYHLNSDEYQKLFKSFIEVNRELSTEMSIPLVDQYRYFEPFYRTNREKYDQLMRDWLHLNPLGNLIMGINICRHFGLPDFELPADLKDPAYKNMKEMDEAYDK